ncbi:hypothetical protein HY230_06435 [Candidatus Acetothermia bacterium]|nr:hypothetical protein [Candidatus Acetothermia bacterium]
MAPHVAISSPLFATNSALASASPIASATIKMAVNTASHNCCTLNFFITVSFEF